MDPTLHLSTFHFVHWCPIYVLLQLLHSLFDILHTDCFKSFSYFEPSFQYLQSCGQVMFQILDLLLFGFCMYLLILVIIFFTKRFLTGSALGGVGRLLEMSLAEYVFRTIHFKYHINSCVDEDAVTHHRKDTMSSSIYGSNALLTKPAHSLAPSFGALLLRPYGYGATTDGSAGYHPDIQYALFYMLVYSNLICAIVQLLLWLFYSLHSQHLKETRRRVIELRE